MNKKYHFVFFGFIPPILFLSHPFFKTDWPLILISILSFTFLMPYVFKNSWRPVLESVNDKGLLFSFLDFLLTMALVIISYTMLLLFFIELGSQVNINGTLALIVCVLIGIQVLRSCFRIALNFVG